MLAGVLAPTTAVRFPGLTARVTVDAAEQRVVVAVRAPMRLPLHVPGSPSRAEIGATGSARVGIDP